MHSNKTPLCRSFQSVSRSDTCEEMRTFEGMEAREVSDNVTELEST